MYGLRFIAALSLACLMGGTATLAQQAKGKAAEPAGPVVVFEFTKGTVEIELFPAEAPQSVEKILGLVRSNFYRGQRIWWVTPALIQFGDPTTRDMTKRDMWGTVGSGRMIGVDETPLAKHKFVRGVVGFGHRPDFDPKTSDSYMFIIKGANSAADGKYMVLGQVTSGMDVVDKLVVPDVIRRAYVKGE
jgi:cyclophilin family peptidyl-prolyl cis-trans isomerase